MTNQVTHFVRRRLQGGRNQPTDTEPVREGWEECGLELPYRTRTPMCQMVETVEACDKAYQVLKTTNQQRYAFACKMFYASNRDRRRGQGTCGPATECMGEETWVPPTNNTANATVSPTFAPTYLPTYSPTNMPTEAPTRSPTLPPTEEVFVPRCGKTKGKEGGQVFYIDIPSLCHDLCFAQDSAHTWTFEQKSTQCRCYHDDESVKVKEKAEYYGPARVGALITCGKIKGGESVWNRKQPSVLACQSLCSEHELMPTHFYYKKGKCNCLSGGKTSALGYTFGKKD